MKSDCILRIADCVWLRNLLQYAIRNPQYPSHFHTQSAKGLSW